MQQKLQAPSSQFQGLSAVQIQSNLLYGQAKIDNQVVEFWILIYKKFV